LKWPKPETNTSNKQAPIFNGSEIGVLEVKGIILDPDDYLNKIKNARQSDTNRKFNYGYALDYPMEYHEKRYDEMLMKAKKVI